MSRLILMLMAVACLARVGVGADRPNIVFLFSDDHAVRTIGAYGGIGEATPNIDRLADEGAVFLRSFCTNSICVPSRATIMTGKHSHANGVLKNGSSWDGSQFVFPRALVEAGYATALIGKWHLTSGPGDEFDHWEVLSGAGGQGHYYNPTFRSKDGGERRITGYSADIIGDLALEWMEGRLDEEEPFLLMAQFKAPHIHRIPPARHMDRYDSVRLPEPETLFTDWAGKNEWAQDTPMRVEIFQEHILNIVPPLGEYDLTERRYRDQIGQMNAEQLAAYHAAYDPENGAYWTRKAAGVFEGEAGKRALTRYKYQRFIKDYLGCVAAVDDNVGRIVAFLEEHGLAENTLVIYSSDQSFFTGEHGWAEKRWAYEPSLMMPFVARWPAGIKPGQRVEAMIQNIDYVPTFLELAGVEIPGDVHGRSLVPLFGGEVPADWRTSIYYHYYEDGSYDLPRIEAVRTETHKLIRHYREGYETFWELYDLRRDPQELENLHDDPRAVTHQRGLFMELDRLRGVYGVPGE